MGTSLVNLSCEQFSDALASKQSIPGGGGVSALTGALAASLAEMVCNFTAGKKKYAQYEEDIERILDKAGSLRHRLLKLVQDDADAFEPLSQAYGIPREDPDRPAIIERETIKACQPPLAMMEAIGECIGLLEELNIKGSKLLISDVGCAALLCRAALEAASYNVYANTQLMNDRKYAGELEARCDKWLMDGIPRAETVASQVMSAIRDRY